ncbi:fimbrial isopeptide formation D2 domain-containing protein [Lactobacillus bombicola]|uniref:Fimbrial isopeptide formation D2 domain-containing protein n=1 Tax=Lactobacillus bombicola TaxID=1505723 RepID=A0A1I1U2Q5_9LACO|nr:isopeptide-forming domain-containing fimbrial protein [Lactobacillus bombicola]SFD62120.1 fimbrial isopeptide formation D2 domain-containing protein [Lactobacillus bombicola]
MNLINLEKRYSLSESMGVLLAIGALAGGLAFSNNSVKADNAQMTNLPKGTNSQSNKIPGEYSFSAKVLPGITKVKPFGGTNSDWATSASHTEDKTKHWFAFQLSDETSNNDDLKGKVGVYYSNVGTYAGHTVDIKITMLDWKVQNYRWVDTNGNGKEDSKVAVNTAYAAFGKDDFEIFTPGMGAVKYRLDYLDHDTHKPVKISAAWSFKDIDGNQWVGIDPSTMSNVDQIYYGDPKTGDTWLSNKKISGVDYIYSDANQHNTPIMNDGHNAGTVTSDQLKGAFTASYSNASSFIINWVFGQNTGKEAIEDQNTLLGLPRIWSMVGKYDPDADTKYPVENISSSIDATFFNHAFLQYSSTAILPDKPKQPRKYVSDADEGTNTPSEIGTDKSVDHNLLKDRYEPDHYQIVHDVPDVLDRFKYDQYIITDNIDPDLDISNIHVYNRANQDVTYMFTVTVDANNKLSVIAKDSSLKQDDFYREQYKITFDGKVKSGVTLADHQDSKHKDQAVIYNEAKVTTSNGSSNSNKTTTNIPFTKKSQMKAVSTDGKGNGKELAVDFDQDFPYTVDVIAQDDENLKSLEIKDKLEPVLNLKNVHIYDLDDNKKDVTDQGKLTTDGNVVDWTAIDATKWHGKHLQMVIIANVKNVAELMKYVDKDSGKIKIPNKAEFIVNDKSDFTNNVDVLPNPLKPSAQKWIELPDLK